MHLSKNKRRFIAGFAAVLAYTPIFAGGVKVGLQFFEDRWLELILAFGAPFFPGFLIARFLAGLFRFVLDVNLHGSGGLSLLFVVLCNAVFYGLMLVLFGWISDRYHSSLGKSNTH